MFLPALLAAPNGDLVIARTPLAASLTNQYDVSEFRGNQWPMMSSPEETRRRLILVCEKLKIDPDVPHAVELADLIARQGDMSMLEASE
jgi:hypothetical protein